MNKLLCLIIGASLALNVTAQPVDRSKPPQAGPARPVFFADPATFTLPNGITVLVVENHKLPRVTASLSIDMGPVLEGKKAGVMQLMGQMLSEGTTKTSKADYDAAIDLIGADVNLYSAGGSTIALTRYFEKAFMLMAEGLRYPALTQESFDKLKKQAIAGLKSGERSAATISGRVVGALNYGKNTAMGEFQTEESIKALTLDDIKQTYHNYITPSRAYLTFVGDITPGAAKSIALKAFADWKGKKLDLPVIPNNPTVKNTEIDFIDLPTAVQGEIRVTTLLNNPMTNPDYHALLLANQVLGGGAEGKLFMNLREKHGFTYGSYSSVGNGRFQSAFTTSAQVRSEKADSAIVEMLREIDNMREGNITQEELDMAKAKLNGSFALGMEDPSRSATYAANILINNLPKDFYRTYLQKLNALTIADLQRVSKKYFSKDNSRIIVVGNGAKIVPNLTRLGYTIKQYDKYAEPVTDKPKDVAVAESPKTSDAISAYRLVEDYLKAIGGKEEVKKLKTVRASLTMEAMGHEFEGTELKMSPNKHFMEVKMGETTVMESTFNGTQGYVAQMGKKTDLAGDELKEAMDDRAIIPQLYYIGADYKTTYLGTGKAGSEDAFKLKVTKPSGKVATEYYSMKTGLLLKEETTTKLGGIDSPITIEFYNYKKASNGNILFPTTIIQTLGEQQYTLTLKDVKINEGVTEADFK
jgi:predicted Zn-dependent peptidase